MKARRGSNSSGNRNEAEYALPKSVQAAAPSSADGFAALRAANMAEATRTKEIWEAAVTDLEAAEQAHTVGSASLLEAEARAAQARSRATQAASDEASDEKLLGSQKAAKGEQFKAAKARKATRQQMKTIMARYVDWDEKTVSELNQPPGVLGWMVTCYEAVRDESFRELPVSEQRLALTEHMHSNPHTSAVAANKCKKFIRGVLEQGAYTLMRNLARPGAASAVDLDALAQQAEALVDARRTELHRLRQAAACASNAAQQAKLLAENAAERCTSSRVEEKVVSPVTNPVLYTWLAGVAMPERGTAPAQGWKLGMPVIVDSIKGLPGQHSQIVLHTENCDTWSVRHYSGLVSNHFSSELRLTPGYKSEYHTLCPYIAAYEAVSELSTEQQHLVGWALQVRLCNDAFETHVCTSRRGETFMELGPNCVHALALGLPETGGCFVDIGAGTGLPLIVAATSKSFKTCFGVEQNVALVNLYIKWQAALIACDATVWAPITNRITMETGDFRHSKALVSHIQQASLVICWNTCFEDYLNQALYKAVTTNMTSKAARLFLGVGTQTELPSLQQLRVPLSLAHTSGVRHCMNTGTGKIPREVSFWTTEEDPLGIRPTINTRSRSKF